MDKRTRQAQLPVEPIYCAAPQEAHDIICPGSDDELDEPARFAKRLRYEEQALRYLDGRPPRLISASLRGPFDKGWQNPWLPKRQNTKSSVSQPTVSRPAVKSIPPKSRARLSGSKDDTPMTRDSMQCHLPSPESNRELQLDDHAGLDPEKRFHIQDWAKSVPPDALDRDEFWAPDQGRGADPQNSSKKRPAVRGWLKSKLSKRNKLDHDAPSPTIHTPTPAAAIVQASTALDPALPKTSLEMTTPSSSTGLCSAKSVAKSFDPVFEAEDTDMSSDSSPSSGDENLSCVSQQETTGVRVDTDAPRASSPESSEDHRQAVPEGNEAGGADIAFESHMDDSFHYWSRPIRPEATRSASPILITTETGAQPEQMEHSGLEDNQRSRSCDIQESTFIIHHPRREYRLAANLEPVDGMAKESQEAHSNDTTSYQRAFSLPSQLCPEGRADTAELDATKRAKSWGPEYPPDKQHESVTFQDNGAVPAPIDDTTMSENRDSVMHQENLPAPLLVSAPEEVVATPKSSHAGETEGTQDVQVEGPNYTEASENSPAIPGTECEMPESTHSTSLKKPVLGDDTTLIGDATHSHHKPSQDTYFHAPDEPSVSNPPSEHPEVGIVAEVVCPMTQNTTPVQAAMPELSVPLPQPDGDCIQDAAQEATGDGLDVEEPAVQCPVSQMESEVAEQTAGSGARLPEHLEERHQTPVVDEHICEEEVRSGEDDQISQSIDTQHIAGPDALDLKNEPVEEGWVPCPRHTTPTSTPSQCPEPNVVGVSQQTPWATTGPEATLELELSVKSFAKFNTPSPKAGYWSGKYPRLSGGHLPSTRLLFDVANTNSWSTGRSQSSQRGSRRGTRRVSFAPLPGEEETANEQPSAKSMTRPESPPPTLDIQEGAEDLDDQFSSHFNAVKRRLNQEPKPCLQRLLPTESQQQLSPAINAMATAFREADIYHTNVLEDCPTPASGLQETVENEEVEEHTEAPQSPWRSDTQTHAIDDVAAVLQNLDDFLNPKWDTETSGKPARRSGGIDCLEDQENRGIQVGLDGPSVWEVV